MKNILLFFLLLSLSAYSQTDSITFKYYVLDKDLSLICKLNDIQYIRLSCSDEKAKNKKFLISFDEYLNGEKVSEDTTYLNCVDQIYEFKVGNDVYRYPFNNGLKMTFDQKDSIFEIRLAGILQKDTFKMFVDYPAVNFDKYFAGDVNYSLRSINCSHNHEIKIQLNKLSPVLAYTPPFENGMGVGSWCLLGMEEVDKWFQKFNVNHYYIINFKVE